MNLFKQYRQEGVVSLILKQKGHYDCVTNVLKFFLLVENDSLDLVQKVSAGVLKVEKLLL